MSLSLRNDIASRIINPSEFIKEAQLEADKAVSLLNDKQTDDGVNLEINKDDSLDKKAEAVIANIDSLLSGKLEANDPAPSQNRVETPHNEPSPTLKTAAAKLISTGINNDAIEDAIANETTKEAGEPRSIDLDAIDVNALNEKVAAQINASGILKKVLKGSLLTGAGFAGGYGLGTFQGNKKLERYVEADKRRDQYVTSQAFRFGQMSVIKKLRDSMAARRNAGEGA